MTASGPVGAEGETVLRIHFSTADVGRVRLAPGPDPLWEIVLSLHPLQQRECSAPVRRWRRQSRTRLPAATRMLTTLVPPRGDFPDFLTPLTDRPRTSIDDGIGLVLRSPRAVLRRDLTALAGIRRPPTWMRRLADGDREQLGELGRLLTEYHRAAIAPHWSHIRTLADRDGAERLRTLRDGGTEHLLRGLPAGATWRFPVLELDYPVRQEIRLDGRGLLLVPSFFCWRTPVTLVNNDQDGTPVLVYPLDERRPEPDDGAPAAVRLGPLVGGTRAAIVRLLDEPGPGDRAPSTSELARDAGIAVSTTSHHLGILREAGIVDSERHGSEVRHRLTSHGRAVLMADTGA